MMEVLVYDNCAAGGVCAVTCAKTFRDLSCLKNRLIMM